MTVLRYLHGLGSAVLLLLAAMCWMTAHPIAAVISSAAAASVVVAPALVRRRRESRFTSLLPDGLTRLAWRADTGEVAFIWRFRKGRAHRVRILRSEHGYADARAALHEQVVVYDAEGDQAIDRSVLPRTTYFYSFIVDRTPDASVIIHLEIPTLSPEERQAIEATYRPLRYSTSEYFCTVDGETTRIGNDPVAERWTDAWLSDGASVVAGGVALATTDAVFTVAELFARERLPDEWVEVE